MGFFTFVNVWWVMMFFTLAVRIKPEAQAKELEYVAAPQTPVWKKLFILNTLISIGVTLFIALIVNSGIIPVKDIV